ncbi:MAG: hypothetical protein M1818_005237 [Claussenomyces sp. TS43310]|nr:MAG: hypothetical protein M1818_005237 [Claussenomyces sp. TS43310]
MARSGGFETPLLRVSRPVAACSRCSAAIPFLNITTNRSRGKDQGKLAVKCDGKLPACTACEKTGRENECSSSNDQFAKGKERRYAPSAPCSKRVGIMIVGSYVASLESRVEKLERRLAYARLRKASVVMHENEDPEGSPDRKDSLATIRAAIHGKAARRREATDVDELVSDFGKM